MNYKHIIWDWNGTLLDDVWLCVDSINLVLKKYALPLISEGRYRELFDFPVKSYYKKLGFDFSRFDFGVVGGEFITEYNKKSYECEIQAGMHDILLHFAVRGISQSVLSAREHGQLAQELDYHGLLSFFDRVAGLSDNYAAGKVDVGRRHLSEIGVSPEKVVLVGDTLHDFEVAEALGTDCVLVAHGHQPGERLAQSGVPVFGGAGELFEWLANKRE